jgi:hypothetical protein
MDLQHYYSKVREVEAKITEEFTVIVSRETPEGGRDGSLTQVARRLAAQMVTDGVARLATAAEKEVFHADQVEAKLTVEQMAAAVAAASRVQFAVLSPADVERLKGGGKSKG